MRYCIAAQVMSHKAGWMKPLRSVVRTTIKRRAYRSERSHHTAFWVTSVTHGQSQWHGFFCGVHGAYMTPIASSSPSERPVNATIIWP